MSCNFSLLWSIRQNQQELDSTTTKVKLQGIVGNRPNTQSEQQGVLKGEGKPVRSLSERLDFEANLKVF